MNYFLDTEFTDMPWNENVQLISIALVDEDCASFYACWNGFDEENSSEFVKNNVLGKLPNMGERKSLECIKFELLNFLKRDSPAAFWSIFPTLKQLQMFDFSETSANCILDQYGDFDFRLMRGILGEDYLEAWPATGSNLTPYLTELKTSNGAPLNAGEHDALSDAIWNRDVWLMTKGKA